MTKRFLVLAFFAISNGAFAADLSQKISLSVVARPMAEVARQIEEKIGVKLTVVNELQRDIILLQITDRPAQEVLDRLAQVTGGEWRDQNDGSKKLMVSGAVLSNQARLKFNIALDGVRKGLAQLLKELEPARDVPMPVEAQAIPEPAEPPTSTSTTGAVEVASPPPGEGDEEDGVDTNVFDTNEASQRLIAKLAQLVDPVAIAKLRDGERVVFSTNPTATQIGFRGAWGPAVSEYVPKHNEAVESQRKAKEKAQNTEQIKNDRIDAMNDIAQRMGMVRDGVMIKAVPAKTLLIFSRGGQRFWGYAQPISIQLTMLDGNGQVIASGNSMLGNAYDPTEAVSAERSPVASVVQKAPKAPKPTTPIEFSAQTKEFMGLTKNVMNGNVIEVAEPKISPELEAKLRRPDVTDPLSFTVAESIAAVAKSKGLNLVANVPDDILTAFESMTGMTEFLNLETVEKEVLARKTVVTTMQDGWMSVAPSDFSESRRFQLDRGSLTELLAEAAKYEILPLDSIATFAARNESGLNADCARTYLSLFAPGVQASGMRGLTDWRLLRIFGMMSSGQKQSLRDGQPIQFVGLNPAQRLEVQKYLYGTECRLGKVGTKASEDDWTAMMMQYAPRVSTTYLEEPTELMPSGLPVDGAITMSIEKDSIVFPVGMAGRAITRMIGAMGSLETAFYQHFTTDPAMAPMANEIPRIDKVRFGDRSILGIRFLCAKGYGANGELFDDRLDKNAATTTMDQAPQAFRDKVARIIASLKKSPLGFFGGASGGVERVKP